MLVELGQERLFSGMNEKAAKYATARFIPEAFVLHFPTLIPIVHVGQMKGVKSESSLKPAFHVEWSFFSHKHLPSEER